MNLREQIRALVERAAKLCEVDPWDVSVNIEVTRPDGALGQPWGFTFELSVRSNVMYGRGRNRKRRAVCGSGSTVGTALDALAVSNAQALADAGLLPNDAPRKLKDDLLVRRYPPSARMHIAGELYAKRIEEAEKAQKAQKGRRR